MPEVTSAKQLRGRLQDVVEKVRHGGRFTVLYRSRPAFDIVPVGNPPIESAPLNRTLCTGLRRLAHPNRETPPGTMMRCCTGEVDVRGYGGVGCGCRSQRCRQCDRARRTRSVVVGRRSAEDDRPCDRRDPDHHPVPPRSQRRGSTQAPSEPAS